MAERARLDTTRLQKMATAYWESAALMAAVELDVFTAIERGHDTIPTLAKAVGISDRNAERLLTVLSALTLIDRDLGGGSGAYSIVATKAFPGLKAIVLDLPPVVVVAREYIAANNASDRVSAVAGDFTTAEFPQGVDVAVMAANLPQYEPALIRVVVGKAFAALAPGGEMHLIGETLHDDRKGPLSAALWGLNESVQGSTGLAHTESEVKGYLQGAGFTQVSVHPFVPGVLTRTTGRKPT